jgi:formate hydrogenlyase subunit 6/NADH:ubiquinone oxidoreductase subunit I
MAFKIDVDQCAGCGVCEGSCKHSSIKQDGDKYKIDASTCTDCGECSDACPMSCISGTKK